MIKLQQIVRTILVVALLVVAAFSAAAQTVRLTTRDAVTIVGTYYPATRSPAPAVLLVHSAGESRIVWEPFARVLQRAGIAALAVDLCGHGESIRRETSQGPVRLDLGTFRPKDFQDMLLDINAAYDWLAGQEGVTPGKIGVMGAGLGANLALRYALFNDELAALVLLSPGLRYREVRADDAIAALGEVPLRICVGLNDAFARESAKRLLELRREAGHAVAATTLTVCTGNLHGTQLLTGVEGLAKQLTDWLLETLGTSTP